MSIIIHNKDYYSKSVINLWDFETSILELAKWFSLELNA